MYVHVPEVRDIPWMLELQAVVSCLMWVVGVELCCSPSLYCAVLAMYVKSRNTTHTT